MQLAKNDELVATKPMITFQYVKMAMQNHSSYQVNHVPLGHLYTKPKGVMYVYVCNLM